MADNSAKDEGKGKGKGKGKEETYVGEASYGVMISPATANAMISSGKRSKDKRVEINRRMAYDMLSRNEKRAENEEDTDNQEAMGTKGSSQK
ncbi:hypothetical protein GTR04_0805 [Trichophyton interdigitale]|uniref:Uncharacterized protein n=1 Tax=Trichophyton interdigitale TaxID=101480 RepID=A0A9P5CXY9_9EURO|nr:hypothetical protein GY631_0551 [Trichophyton interdigitale]KAF3900866.1 hypothetical protein GY632_0483 [Trichophyton interdigitale]KAG8211823.1 hypothetical protein GTR04_0805 [Trichophyton interdigitale]